MIQSGSIKDYSLHAERCTSLLDTLVELVTRGNLRLQIVPAPHISLESTTRKVDRRGGIRNVTDLVRVTVVFDVPHDLLYVFQKLNNASRVNVAFRV